MSLSNLIGFAIGIDGARYLASQILAGWAGASTVLLFSAGGGLLCSRTGLRFVAVATVELFAFAQLMFEYRYASAWTSSVLPLSSRAQRGRAAKGHRAEVLSLRSYPSVHREKPSVHSNETRAV
jgi:hypothetical protein